LIAFSLKSKCDEEWAQRKEYRRTLAASSSSIISINIWAAFVFFTSFSTFFSTPATTPSFDPLPLGEFFFASGESNDVLWRNGEGATREGGRA
jgi:hypothetical protein